MKKVALLCVVALCLAACHCERKTTGKPCRKAACQQQCERGNYYGCKHNKSCKCHKGHPKAHKPMPVAAKPLPPAPVKTAQVKAAEQSSALAAVGTTKTQGNRVSLQYKEPIHFGHNSAVIENVSKSDINTTATILKKYPDSKVVVKGYTDSLGNPAYNVDLSQRRAQAVADELIKQGVKAENVTAIGYGAANPVASNDTVEGRRQNRRVELEIETK